MLQQKPVDLVREGIGVTVDCDTICLSMSYGLYHRTLIEIYFKSWRWQSTFTLVRANISLQDTSEKMRNRNVMLVHVHGSHRQFHHHNNNIKNWTGVLPFAGKLSISNSCHVISLPFNSCLIFFKKFRPVPRSKAVASSLDTEWP